MNGSIIVVIGLLSTTNCSITCRGDIMSGDPSYEVGDN